MLVDGVAASGFHFSCVSVGFKSLDLGTAKLTGSSNTSLEHLEEGGGGTERGHSLEQGCNDYIIDAHVLLFKSVIHLKCI